MRTRLPEGVQLRRLGTMGTHGRHDRTADDSGGQGGTSRNFLTKNKMTTIIFLLIGYGLGIWTHRNFTK